MSKYLLCSLGHNSSAIFYEGGTLIGYEQERFDLVKSSSAPPIDCIKMIETIVDLTNATLCISHWFPLKSNVMETKYAKGLSEYVEKYNMKVMHLTKDFDHHDAHAYSSLGFLSNYEQDSNIPDYHFIVADGYGNDDEVFSVYRRSKEGNNLTCIYRVHGLQNSLGLLYQFATSFVGMKENQDEYKLLGYESMIDTLNIDVLQLHEDILLAVSQRDLTDHRIRAIDLDLTFQETKDSVHSSLEVLCDSYGITDETEKRILVAYYVQGVLEQLLKEVIHHFGIQKACLSGGVFYNVKLNNEISKIVDKICVMPVCGDQGASLGFLTKLGISYNFNLLIGHRKFMEPNLLQKASVEKIVDLLTKGNIVNLIGDTMEFGPRALGHTSSLFLPFNYLVSINNKINNRNEVMPCAPIMLEKNAKFFFNEKDLEKVVGSLYYMIIALDYKTNHLYKEYDGVMHKYPYKTFFTGRPQIVKEDSMIGKILQELDERTGIKCLVNTSFNFHGTPIVFTLKNIYDCLEKQKSPLHNTFFL